MKEFHLAQVRHNRRTAIWIGFDKPLTAEEMEILVGMNFGDIKLTPSRSLSLKFTGIYVPEHMVWYRVRNLNMDDHDVWRMIWMHFRPRSYGISGFIHEKTRRLPHRWHRQAVDQGLDLSKIRFY